MGNNKSEDLDEKEEYNEENKIKEKTIIMYCDVMGNMHHGVKKLNKRQHKMNGRYYTPTMKCAYPGCMKTTRVMCYQCHAPFCYPVMNFTEKEELDICFVKHVDSIKKRNKNRLAKMKGNKG